MATAAEVVAGGLSALAVFAFIAYGGSMCCHLISIIYCRIHCNKKPVGINREKVPGISILKPLKGIDVNLAENLESFFTVDYPQYELLVCVHEESDPAVGIVRPLMEKYPRVNCQLFVGGSKVGVNPKINNMNAGYLASKYDLIMISDAGVKIDNETLYDLITHMKDDVGLVHQMPYVLPRKGFAGMVEMVYFGGGHARMYLAADALGINCVTGMSCLIRKSILQDMGGMSELGKYIAEDYFMGKACLDRGFKVTTGSKFATQNSGTYSLGLFKSRMARWCKIRLATVPLSILCEPLTECLTLGAYTAWAVYYLLHFHPLVFYFCHLLVWFILDYIQLTGVQNGSLPFNKFEFAVAWLTREVFIILAYLEAVRNPRLQWRNGKFRLKWGGVAEELKPDEEVRNCCCCYVV